MHSTLTQGELALVQGLENKGMVRHAAILGVVMLTREHPRPYVELIDILGQYSGLDNPNIAREAIDILKNEDWLVDQKFGSVFFVKKAVDFRRKVAIKLGVLETELTARSVEQQPKANVSILGDMSDRTIYTSYLELLRSAQSEILLPMLATTSKLQSVSILQDRAACGVEIRILLGSASLVNRLRGASMRQRSVIYVKEWENHFRKYRSVKIRIVTKLEHSLLATSMLIDSRLLRFDVYDPEIQRSLDGTMIQIESPPGVNPNITRLFALAFEEAWRAARPVGSYSRFLVWLMAEAWQWWLFAIFLVLTGISAKSQKHGYLSSVFGSVAATFAVNGLVASWPRIRKFLRIN